MWEVCCCAYLMLAETADREDQTLRLSQVLQGETPDGYPCREALDEMVRGA